MLIFQKRERERGRKGRRERKASGKFILSYRSDYRFLACRMHWWEILVSWRLSLQLIGAWPLARVSVLLMAIQRSSFYLFPFYQPRRYPFRLLSAPLVSSLPFSYFNSRRYPCHKRFCMSLSKTIRNELHLNYLTNLFFTLVRPGITVLQRPKLFVTYSIGSIIDGSLRNIQSHDTTTEEKWTIIIIELHRRRNLETIIHDAFLLPIEETGDNVRNNGSGWWLRSENEETYLRR